MFFISFNNPIRYLSFLFRSLRSYIRHVVKLIVLNLDSIPFKKCKKQVLFNNFAFTNHLLNVFCWNLFQSVRSIWLYSYLYDLLKNQGRILFRIIFLLFKKCYPKIIKFPLNINYFLYSSEKKSANINELFRITDFLKGERFF